MLNRKSQTISATKDGKKFSADHLIEYGYFRCKRYWISKGNLSQAKSLLLAPPFFFSFLPPSYFPPNDEIGKGGTSTNGS